MMRRVTLGYREARLAADCSARLLGRALRGHEFHYATIASAGRDELRFRNRRLRDGGVASGFAKGPRHRLVFHVIAEA